MKTLGSVMGTKYKNLYKNIISEESLQKAFEKASNGKKSSHGFLIFNDLAQYRLNELHKSLIDKSWQPQEHRVFTIYEPKKRIIGAPCFKDRIVHHAVCAVIEPIFDKTFLPYSFACRKGKGTHAGVKHLQALLRTNKYPYYLKTDFKAFFPSIDREILNKEIRKKISCKDTLDLIEKIIPPTGKGVPIGALTSQLSANIYGNLIDHYLHHQLKVKFVRYMDDIVILGSSIKELKEIKEKIKIFANEQMRLSISRWQIAPITRGINFLGYRIWKNHKLLRKSSVTKAKQKIKIYTKKQDYQQLRKFIGAWRGHAITADTKNLRVWLNKQYEVAKFLEQAEKQSKPNRKQMLENLIYNN